MKGLKVENNDINQDPKLTIGKIHKTSSEEKLKKEQQKYSLFQETNSPLWNDISNEQTCSAIHPKTDEYSKELLNIFSSVNINCSTFHISYPIDIVYTNPTSHSSLH